MQPAYQKGGDQSALPHALRDITARVGAAECDIKLATGTESAVTTDTVNPDATARIGKWEMRVAAGEATREAEQRWNDRVDALAAWLQSELEREQAAPTGKSR